MDITSAPSCGSWTQPAERSNALADLLGGAFSLFLFSLPFRDSLSQEEFNLSVRAAELVRCPLLQLTQKFGRDAKKEGLSVAGHSTR
jgi:hypothetical protein